MSFMNQTAIARIGREKHLEMLIGRLPLITVIYGVQCYILLQMENIQHAKDLSSIIGIFLVTLIVGLFIHDKYHQVLLYNDHLVVFFGPFNHIKKINYSDIITIEAPENECDFSSILLKLENNTQQAIHFVDYPLQVKSFIEELKKKKDLKTAA